MVELMVGANADPLLTASTGETAHALATKRHRVALVIAEASAIHAIESSNMPALLEAIENGAYVNIHNAAGWTPLIFATASGNVEAVQTLLRKGAEPDRQENDGWTALMFAASSGNEKLVTMLLQNGASAGIRSGVAGDGPTAKEIATEEGHAEVAALIPNVVEAEL
jgi:ankyrin repeat protein